MKAKNAMRPFKPQAYAGIGACALLMASSAHAAAMNVSIATMIENIAATVPALMQLVTAMAYVMGFFFVMLGVVQLRKYGEQRSMMTSEVSFKGPLIYLAVGAALIYLPSSVAAGMTSFWAEPMPYAYVTSQTDPWSQFYQACFSILQLIGTITFIRGLVLMSRLGGHAQSGEFGKALAHMIGGIFCIDMYDFIHAVFNTLGITWVF